VPSDLALPERFSEPRVCLPGVLVITGPAWTSGNGSPSAQPDTEVERFCRAFPPTDAINRFPLIAIVDDSPFCARNVNNFLWTVFTRSNPADDVYGIGEFISRKHWGCEGALVIDARIKSHHAPPLVEDPHVTKSVDAMAARGGPLAKYL
jgi:4-hydroxy-3-polyprenylbenzoate decarboxylase